MAAEDGFFSRWSRRKADRRAGREVAPEPPAPDTDVPPVDAPAADAAATQAGSGVAPMHVAPALADAHAPAAPSGPTHVPAHVPASTTDAPARDPEPPPPTLDDVRSLTFDADVRRFVAPDVAPEVKTAAVKKLFADPRFNVRDAMDVYADDYTQPDPLPESMLRQLASSRFLKLFDVPATEGSPGAPAGNDRAETVAQSAPEPEAVHEPTHADPDLQLQPDDAAPAGGAGDGAGRDAAGAHDLVPPRRGELPGGDAPA